MTTRERRMAIVLGGVVGVAGVYFGLQRYIIEPRAQLLEQIAAERKTQAELEKKLAPKLAIKNVWRERTSITLPNDQERAALAFRADISELLRRNRLTESQTLSPKPVKRLTGLREGFSEVPIGISVEGTLASLVNFLRDVYQRPYVKRIDSLVIDAPETEVKTREGPVPDPKLNINLTLSTLLLPDVPGLASAPLDPAELDSAATLENTKLKPYLAHEPAAYARIHAADTHPFKLYEPPPPPKPPVRKPPAVAEAKPKPPPPPPPPVRPDAEHMLMLGGTALHGEWIAYVQDERSALDPPREFRLNDPMDDGRLVLIDPRGCVVRSRTTEGRRRDYALWYYQPGATWADRQPLTETDHPEMYGLVQEVLRLSQANAKRPAERPRGAAEPSNRSPAGQVAGEQADARNDPS